MAVVVAAAAVAAAVVAVAVVAVAVVAVAVVAVAVAAVVRLRGRRELAADAVEQEVELVDVQRAVAVVVDVLDEVVDLGTTVL